MPLIQTNTGRKIFKKAESMLVVPYVYNSRIGDYALGETVYDISAVIGDSIVLEQSEGTTETKENEFRSEPLLQATSGAKCGFTAQCLDLQNNVLKALFNAMTVGDHGIAAFNDDYSTLYALIRIGFGGQDTPDIILPKVQLNSRIFIQQLRTRAGQGNISGTANSFNVAIKDPVNPGHLLQFAVPATNGTTYTPYTPVLFVPRGYTPLFRYRYLDDRTDEYKQINFTNGTLSSVYVHPSGTWSNSYMPA